ncbi:MAG: YbhB/YbcL family Raf kinase inhibitor-like protein [Solirubrobacterales bacterium]
MAQNFFVDELEISSPAFDDHGRIPDKHTSNGENISPALEWTGVPEGTVAFAVVVHDPDAPLVDGWTHWVAYGIPGDATGLPEGAADLVEGPHTGGEDGYSGPAPPPGHGKHHYYFWVYALNEEPDLEPGLSRRELLEAIEDSVIEQARVIGTYDN